MGGMPIFMGGGAEPKNPYPDFYLTDLNQVQWLIEAREREEGKEKKSWTGLIRKAFGSDENALLTRDETGAFVPAPVEKMIQYGGGLSGLISKYILEPIATIYDAFKGAKEYGKEEGKGCIKILNEKYPLDAYKPEAFESKKAMKEINDIKKMMYLYNKEIISPLVTDLTKRNVEGNYPVKGKYKVTMG